MALTYSIHPESGRGNGANNSLPAPILRIDGGQRSLAHGTPSEDITGPCEICVIADEDSWLDASTNPAELNTGTTTLKLIAGTPQWFSIMPGVWKIQGAAA